MSLRSLLSVDDGTFRLLGVALGILLFFTVLFYTWRAVKPRAFLAEMITRTHSWWIIYALSILFFCINPSLGFVGLALLAIGAWHEFNLRLPAGLMPQRVRWMVTIFIVFEFFAAAQGAVLLTMAFLPISLFVLVTIWVLLFEPRTSAMTAPSTAMWGLSITALGLSHLALLLALPKMPSFAGSMAGILLYYIFLTQFNDVLQFLWGTIFGKHKIAPDLSPKKTWEGFLGAAATTTIIAFLLRDMTPFSAIQSLIVGAILAISGYFGDLNISAVKRNLNIKDMGQVIPGHGGLLDRLDSITLSSLVYVYLIVYWFYDLSLTTV